MYHSEHKESSMIGVFSYLKPNVPVITPDQTVTSSEPLTVSNKKTNRALEGDHVYYTTTDTGAEVVGIHKRNPDHKRIVGVLQITSSKRYGNTKRGLPIYNFVPLSWHYPNFMVASNIRSKWSSGPIKNVYVLIELVEWTTSQKYPMGRCVSVIGPVNDEESLDTALLNKNQLYTKSYKRPLPEPTPPPSSSSRTDHTTECIIAIDPEGALDLDDAFHIEHSDSHMKIYVHIADVDDVFHHQDPVYEQEIRKRLTSIYGHKKVYNMLPPEFSNSRISLNTKDDKSAVTIVLTACQIGNSPKLEGIEYYLSTVRVTKCMTYEKAQLVLDSPPNMSTVSQSIHMLSCATGHTDTHKMIESIMIATNVYIGKVIREQLQTPSLVRVMPPLPKTKDEGVLSYLKYRGSKGAKYMATDRLDTDTEPAFHGGLGVTNYVHFTSPIRRYPDLIIHRIIKGTAQYTYEQLTDLADQLNSYNLHVKRYYRDNAVMKLSYTIPSGKTHHTMGYIVDYQPDTNYVFVYLPEYEIEYKYPLFNDNLQNIITVVDTEQILHVTNNHRVETYDVPKYELLDITLSVNPESIRLNGRVILSIDGLSDLFF